MFHTTTAGLQTVGGWQTQSAPPPPLPPGACVDVVSWNVDFMAPHAAARMRAALAHLAAALPPRPQRTVVLLQEVLPASLRALLRSAWVRAHFQASDGPALALDYFTLTLATRDLPVRCVRREAFAHTAMRRDVLLADVALAGGAVLRVANTHLESLPAPGAWLRPRQMARCAGLLRERGVRAGVLAGDMNAIAEADEATPEEVALADVWGLDAGAGANARDGHTWGYQPKCRFPPGRLDKVLYTGNLEWEPVDGDRMLKRVGVGLRFEEEDGEISGWVSDHYGLWARARLD